MTTEKTDFSGIVQVAGRTYRADGIFVFKKRDFSDNKKEIFSLINEIITGLNLDEISLCVIAWMENDIISDLRLSKLKASRLIGININDDFRQFDFVFRRNGSKFIICVFSFYIKDLFKIINEIKFEKYLLIISNEKNIDLDINKMDLDIGNFFRPLSLSILVEPIFDDNLPGVLNITQLYESKL